MSLANARIAYHELEYNEDGTPVRQYLNDDPGTLDKTDRPDYDHLSLNDPYFGYRDIVWTPLDLPLLDIDMDHVYNVATKPSYQKNFYETKNVGRLVFLKPNHCGQPAKNPDWYEFAREEFPDVIKYVEALPFKSIYQVFFVQTQKPIPAHYDEELGVSDLLRLQAPSHMHFRWSKVTDWRNEHFYMTRDSGATRIYPSLPPTTNGFAYDGGVFEHGVDRGFSMQDRVQLVIHGVYDMQKWLRLLEDSYAKYSEYAITAADFDDAVRFRT